MTANLSPGELSRIVEMAWEDRTSFDAIERSTGLSEGQVIALMRHQASTHNKANR